MKLKYYIDYQYLEKDASRPSDEGEIVGIQIDDKSGFAILPNVGDYVDIDNSINDQRDSFKGRVRSKLFNYRRGSNDEMRCNINIVVEETDEDWGKLIKE